MRKIVRSGKPIEEEFRKINLARKDNNPADDEHIITPEEIIEQAQEEATRMKSQAEMEVLEIKDNAKQEGHDEGYAAGLEEGKNELAHLIGTLRDTESELYRQKIETLKGAEKELVELSLAIAKKVLRYELEHSREVVVKAVQESIPLLVERDEVLIRVHPQDVEVIQESSSRIKDKDNVICKLEIIGDDRIARGGAVVQSSSGSVDSDVAILMENLEKELRAIMPTVTCVSGGADEELTEEAKEEIDKDIDDENIEGLKIDDESTADSTTQEEV